MRHRTVAVTRSVFAGFLAIAMIAGFSPAVAQVVTDNLIVACKGTNCAGFGGAGASPYTDLQDAIDDAVALAANVGTVTVLIIEDDSGAPWTGTALNIPADADIRILGVPDDVSTGGAFSVVLEGTGAAPVITIDGATLTEPTDRLEIEGVTLTGGTDGILITGTTDAGNTTDYAPVINRCYITANNENGVRVEGNAQPFLVNNSINLNGQDGVHVGDGIGGVGSFADVLHCSILENGANGVYVEAGNDARVRNTLVYRNGNADGEGGLVWATNAFINPEEGPVTGGTTVEINGENFGASTGAVYFGPPNRADTEATNYTWSDTQITCDTPASWTGNPGPVDVYIVRDDGTVQMSQVVRDGFTYLEQAAGVFPVVSHVVPEWGPRTGQNWVYVYGANFDANADVSFGGISAPRVNWINSGQLHVKVPAATAAGKVEVQVENDNGNISAITPPEDYEYRDTTELAPSIVQITPNYYRDVEGSESSSEVFALADVVGFYFADDAVVKIGGIVCPHGPVQIINGASSPPLLNITDVQIPVAEFGAGGSYDVEVVNPSGLRDVLPKGFTYYANSEPHTNPDGPADGADTLNENKWRAANPGVPSGGNMVLLGVGGQRVLLGHSFDHEIRVTFDEAVTVGGPITYNNVLPTDATFPHNQREVLFPFPGFPNSFPLNLQFAARAIPVQVRNTATVMGNPSTFFGADTTMYYCQDIGPGGGPGAGSGEGLYFEITDVRVTALGSPDTVEIDVRNWRDSMRIFVGQALATPTNVSPNPPAAGNIATVEFQVPAQGQQGFFGPVDIRVELASGDDFNGFAETLYTVAENAYSYRRLDDSPQVYSVIPRSNPDTLTHITVLGANFIGPAGNAANTDVFTRFVLVWDNGNEITIAPGEPGVSNYEVTSFSEINFDFDLSAVPFIIVDNPTDFPRGSANLVDIRAEQVQGTTILTDSGGANLESTLPDALYFEGGLPTITSVTPAEGPVSGFNAITGAPVQITIDGANFGGTDSIVRFGSAEAEIVTWDPAQIVVELPPAPQGLPGVYDVTVIRDDVDEQQAVLHNGFTYFMDGRPIVTEIEANHASYDPGDDSVRYVTIRGYNFDDIVRVTFTDPGDGDADERTFYAVSPTEIVVSLPVFSTILDPPGGEATLEVTVQNDPNPMVPHTPTEEANLTSNSVNFYVYDDTRGDVSPAVPEFAFNDVYFNWEDYINTQPGVGSISVDPMLDTGPNLTPVPGPKVVVPQPGGWWYGKLLATELDGSVGRDNPIRNKGGEYTVEPYTSADFEYEPRPDPPQNENIQGTGSTDASLPDIGADEINGYATDECRWFFARPTPSPAGKLDRGDLLVEIRVSSGCIDPIAFIAPQGGDPSTFNPSNSDSTTDECIGLELVSRIGTGVYLYRSEEAIETVLIDSDLDELPSHGDIIVDGHAAIYLIDAFDTSPTPNIIGFDEGAPFASSGSLRDETGLIEGQAVYGRHFLIDTVPPRIFVESYADETVLASDLIYFSDDLTDANDADPPSHPFLPIPATLSDGTRWDPANIDVPVSYLGAITLPPLAGVDGVKAFFNNGSIANTFPATDLNFGVIVRYIDRPVTVGFDPNGEAIDQSITDTDIYTGLTTRQVSGFLLPDEIAPDPGELDVGAGRWLFAAGGNLVTGVPVTVTYDTEGAPVNPNAGVFEPDLIPGDGDYIRLPDTPDPDVLNDQLTADWVVGPIDWNIADSDTFHVEARLIAEDLAGNATPDLEEFETDPLHIWWLIDVQSRLVPDREGLPSNNPTFTMQVNRTLDPLAEGGPVPIFSYRVYASDDYQGVYLPVMTGWTPWSSSTSIDTIATLPGVLGRWVLVVSQVADESGNVEPWPTIMGSDAGPIDLSDPVLHQLALSLPNWQRFFFSGDAAPDTRVDPTFWHDVDQSVTIDPGEPNFGQSRLIPLPSDLTIPVRAQFLVSTVRPPGTTGDYLVYWEFIEAGEVVQSGVSPLPLFTTDSQVFPIYASVPGNIINTAAPGYLGDTAERRIPVTYVFRAAAFLDSNLNGAYDPLDGEIMDPTPANVYFTVVPTGVSNYIKAPTDDDSQPIKEQEIR